MIKLLLKINMSEYGTKLTLGNCSLKPLTCVFDKKRIFSLIFILAVTLNLRNY